MPRIDRLSGNQEIRTIVRRLNRADSATPLNNASISRGGLTVRSAGGLTVDGLQTVTGTSLISGTETVSGSEIINGSLVVNGTGDVYGTFSVLAPGTLFVNGGASILAGLNLSGIPTTGSAANLRRTALGVVQEVTSAAKFKIDPQIMDLPRELLDVPVEWWIDRSDAEIIAKYYDAPRPLTQQQHLEYEGAALKRIPGVIAEKVLAAGGEAFVGFDLDGSVRSVLYDRLAIARTALLAQENAELKARLAKLEKTVAKLTGSKSD